MSPPFLSVVVPAYNEGRRLPRFLERLVDLALLPGRPPTELLVVDDGSAAEHAAMQREAAEKAAGRLAASGRHRLRYVAAPRNQGKGAAIRLGWREADPNAAWLGFVDADGAVGAPELWRLAGMLPAAEHDVLAGARILMAGRHIERSLFRHLQGRVFATLAERALGLGFYDTQCGVKFARAPLLRPRLDDLREERWLLDVELLALLQKDGARCLEVPIDWADQGESKVAFGLDALRMFRGLGRLARRVEQLPELRQAPDEVVAERRSAGAR
ncbi:MAG TPA: glycosyltransferase [Anaeromyxobacteraceae bacterium]|nr:glycosyltransferase [Anaeromyxobacteraceae bacterium]